MIKSATKLSGLKTSVVFSHPDMITNHKQVTHHCRNLLGPSIKMLIMESQNATRRRVNKSVRFWGSPSRWGSDLWARVSDVISPVCCFTQLVAQNSENQSGGLRPCQDERLALLFYRPHSLLNLWLWDLTLLESLDPEIKRVSLLCCFIVITFSSGFYITKQVCKWLL